MFDDEDMQDRVTRRGIWLSGIAHATALFLAVFGGQIFDSDDAEALQVSEVDLVSAAAFDAAVSSAPEAPRTAVADIVPPEAGASDIARPEETLQPSSAEVESPDAPDEETKPDLTSVRQRVTTEVPIAPPDAPTLAEEDREPEGVSLITPSTEGPNVPELENRKPNVTTLARPAPPLPAPRIAPQPVPKPPELSKKADEASPEVAPSDTAEQPRDEKPEESPEETATEIVPETLTEPEETESPAPVVSSRPRGRPDSVVAAAKAKLEEGGANNAAEAKPQRTAEAKPATEAATPKPARGTDAVTGPPLTSREKDGITLKVKRRWNIGRLQGLENWQSLVVTVRFELDRSGKVVGRKVVAVKPRNPSGALEIAFQVARAAVLRSEPYDLPVDKYARWKTVEITFNPSKGINF